MTSPVSPTPAAPSIGWVHIDAQRWALTQMARKDVTPLAKLVLFAMAAHVRDDKYEVWPSQDRLAALVGATRQGVRLAIDGLESAGLLTVIRSDAAMRAPHTYLLRCEETLHRCKDDGAADVNGVSTKVHVQPEVHRTSTARARQQTLDDATEAVLGFPVQGGVNATWTLRQAFVDELAEAFPKLDVMAECRAALGWLRANPAKRKTADGMRRFLTAWLGRARERRDIVAAVAGGASDRGPTAAQARQRAIDRSTSGDHFAEALAAGRVDDEDGDA